MTEEGEGRERGRWAVLDLAEKMVNYEVKSVEEKEEEEKGCYHFSLKSDSWRLKKVTVFTHINKETPTPQFLIKYVTIILCYQFNF